MPRYRRTEATRKAYRLVNIADKTFKTPSYLHRRPLGHCVAVAISELDKPAKEIKRSIVTIKVISKTKCTMSGTNEPDIHAIHEPSTGTWQYIVADPDTRCAAIIDPVLDFDNATSRILTTSADALLQKVAMHHKFGMLLEAHLHADRISAAFYLREALRQRQTCTPKCCIGSGIEKMQNMFGWR